MLYQPIRGLTCSLPPETWVTVPSWYLRILELQHPESCLHQRRSQLWLEIFAGFFVSPATTNQRWVLFCVNQSEASIYLVFTLSAGDGWNLVCSKWIIIISIRSVLGDLIENLLWSSVTWPLSTNQMLVHFCVNQSEMRYLPVFLLCPEQLHHHHLPLHQ